jgi:hypothetical protein
MCIESAAPSCIEQSAWPPNHWSALNSETGAAYGQHGASYPSLPELSAVALKLERMWKERPRADGAEGCLPRRASPIRRRRRSPAGARGAAVETNRLGTYSATRRSEVKTSIAMPVDPGGRLEMASAYGARLVLVCRSAGEGPECQTVLTGVRPRVMSPPVR